MPKKIRELKKMLKQANFQEVKGKGSHTNWIHPKYPGKVTLAGKDGDDAKRYQEKEVLNAIQVVKQNDRKS